jgi:hypothetical protein
VSRFFKNPGMPRWDAMKRIFRYLNGTRDTWLTYGDGGSQLVGYADANGSTTEDRKTLTGYAFMINGSAVSWNSKQQGIVLALSTTESEYVASTEARAKEALWLRSMLAQLFTPLDTPTTLFGDNQSAIALAKDHQ